MNTEPIRKRWRDQSRELPERAPLEARAAGFFRALKPIPRDPNDVSRLLSELVEKAGRGERGLPRTVVVFRVAIAALILGSFGAALAVGHPIEWLRRAMARSAPAVVHAQRAFEPSPTPQLAPELVPAVEVPAPVHPIGEPIAEPALPRPSGPHASRAVTRTGIAPAPVTAAPAARSPATSAPSPDDSLPAETSMLDQALDALGKRRPQDALEALGAYRRRFPHGKLEYEADLAEVKAQVALGKDAPALAVLDRAIAMRGFGTLPRSPDLSLLRAELLARTGDCAGAVTAFSLLLEGGRVDPGFQERALYGRAVCFEKLGRHDQSRSALRDYLNRFPDGRFVHAAQDALDPLP